MIDKSNIIDFQEITKKIKPETPEEVMFIKETLNSVVDRAGLRGFFVGQTSPDLHGIVLDYDAEEVKKEIEKAKGIQ